MSEHLDSVPQGASERGPCTCKDGWVFRPYRMVNGKKIYPPNKRVFKFPCTICNGV